jgi:hypothetical protein
MRGSWIFEITQKGGRSISHYKSPSLYRLTYVNGRAPSPLPTDNWKFIGTKEAALAALAVIEKGPKGNGYLQTSSKKPGAKTTSKEGRKRPSLATIPGGENAPPTLGPKTPLLSIFRVGRGSPSPQQPTAPNGRKRRPAAQKPIILEGEKIGRADVGGETAGLV